MSVATAGVLVLGLAWAVAAAGHPDTAAGVVTGGLTVVVVALAARVRTLRRSDRAGSLGRAAAGLADERDVRIHTASLAWVGIVSLLLSALASAATYLDVPADGLVRSMPFALMVTAAVAFLVINRRT